MLSGCVLRAVVLAADACLPVGFLLRESQTADAQLVLVGPATAAWPVKDTDRAVDAQLSAAASAAGVSYVSPLRDGWVTESNFAEFIDPATRHPSNTGHAEFAARLLDTLS